MEKHRARRMARAFSKKAETPRLIKFIHRIQKTFADLSYKDPLEDAATFTPRLDQKLKTFLCAAIALQEVEFELERRDFNPKTLEVSYVKIETSFDTHPPQIARAYLWESIDGAPASYIERSIWSPVNGGSWSQTYDDHLRLLIKQEKESLPVQVTIEIVGEAGTTVTIEDVIIRLAAEDIHSLGKTLEVDVDIQGPKNIIDRLQDFFSTADSAVSRLQPIRRKVFVTDE